jgi:hypothetical protein
MFFFTFAIAYSTRLEVLQSTRVVSYSYSNASYILLKVTIVAGFHLKEPDFDPLGVVDLGSTLERHESSRYVCSFLSLDTLSLSRSYFIVFLDCHRPTKRGSNRPCLVDDW